LQNFATDLETIRKIYERDKDEPPIPRNFPPVSGRIGECFECAVASSGI